MDATLDPVTLLAWHATQVPPYYDLPVSALNQAGFAIRAWAAAHLDPLRQALGDLRPEPLSILLTFADGGVAVDVSVTLEFETVEGTPWTAVEHRLTCVFSSCFPPLGHCTPTEVRTMGALQIKAAGAAVLLLDALRRGAQAANLKIKPAT